MHWKYCVISMLVMGCADGRTAGEVKDGLPGGADGQPSQACSNFEDNCEAGEQQRPAAPGDPGEASPDLYDFEPLAGVTEALISDVVLRGSAEGPQCCFDLNGDGVLDNTIGMVVSALLDLGTANAHIPLAITFGPLASVLQHQEQDVASGNPSISSYRARWVEGGATSAQRVVFEGPEQLFANTTVRESELEASEGILDFPLRALGSDHWLRLHRVTLSATSTHFEDRWVLSQGRIGGAIRLEDVAEFLNGAATSCECLGLEGEPLLKPDFTCEDVETTGCSLDCADVNAACEMAQWLPSLADVDVDDDGTEDALSFGATFEAQPAQVGR